MLCDHVSLTDILSVQGATKNFYKRDGQVYSPRRPTPAPEVLPPFPRVLSPTPAENTDEVDLLILTHTKPSVSQPVRKSARP